MIEAWKECVNDFLVWSSGFIGISIDCIWFVCALFKRSEQSSGEKGHNKEIETFIVTKSYETSLY